MYLYYSIPMCVICLVFIINTIAKGLLKKILLDVGTSISKKIGILIPVTTYLHLRKQVDKLKHDGCGVVCIIANVTFKYSSVYGL